jgi:1-phosphofructokinase family hexose kinase
MILCVTLNPCLDKTLTVPAWRPGDNVRGVAVREVVGGKGNNVARALTRLGRNARPVTFLGGPIGAHCSTLLRSKDGFDPIVIPSDTATRVILTVRTQETNEQSAFFDPDPAISAAEASALVGAIGGAIKRGGIEALTLSGSSPSPETHDVFGQLVSLARMARIPVFLDTYGPALAAISSVWPDVLQLNRREAGAHLGTSKPSDAEVFRMLDDWGSRGVQLALVTDGPGPVLIRAGEQRLCAQPPVIEPLNPIGSGDCLLAGLVEGWVAGRDPEAMLRHGLACAVANALIWDAGAIEPEEVRRWEAAIQIATALT